MLCFMPLALFEIKMSGTCVLLMTAETIQTEDQWKENKAERHPPIIQNTLRYLKKKQKTYRIVCQLKVKPKISFIYLETYVMLLHCFLLWDKLSVELINITSVLDLARFYAYQLRVAFTPLQGLK